MSQLPKAGERAICELHCQILTASSEDDPNWDRLASIKGARYADIWIKQAAGAQRTPTEQATWHDHGGHMADDGASAAGLAAWATSRVAAFAGAIGLGAVCPDSWRSPADAGAWGEQAAARGPVSCLSWHPRRETLAVADDQCQVHVCSYLAAHRQSGSDPLELVRTFPARVQSLAWRPCASGTLAVGTSKGTYIWTIAATGQGAEGLTPWGACAESHPTAGLSDAKVQLLEGSGGVAAGCLAWNPLGRLLAVGSASSSAVTIWDVSTGEREKLNGAAGAVILRWSPTNDYLWCALANSTCFQIWETAKWTHEKWGGGHVGIREGAWAPTGRALFVGLDGQQQAAALYLTAPPPSLDANLLPVELPDVGQKYPELRSEGTQLLSHTAAWDPQGDRLAMVVRRPVRVPGSSAKGERVEPAGEQSEGAGGGGADDGSDGEQGVAEDLVALFSTRQFPMISLTLLGLIRGPKHARVSHLEFHPGHPKGSLLAVAWSIGCVSVYPLYYKKSF